MSNNYTFFMCVCVCTCVCYTYTSCVCACACVYAELILAVGHRTISGYFRCTSDQLAVSSVNMSDSTQAGSVANACFFAGALPVVTALQRRNKRE